MDHSATPKERNRGGKLSFTVEFHLINVEGIIELVNHHFHLPL